MKRVALLLLCAAACGGSGFNTGEAMIMGPNPAAKSASATPFTDNGMLGWKIEFFDAAPGGDCMDEKLNVVASIGIYTTQAADATHTYADLPTGDIVIVTMSPPMVQGTAAANMGATDLNGIVGNVTITDFYKDHVNGSLNAGGKDMTGTGVAVTGDFKAPTCGTI